MPLPDRHADELTIEIDEDKYQLWCQAKAAAKAWQAEADRLATDLVESLHGFTAGTVHGEKVVSHRFKDQYATGRLVKEYPDLTKHFMKSEVVEKLDMLAFAIAHPDVAERYRVREFKGLE